LRLADPPCDSRSVAARRRTAADGISGSESRTLAAKDPFGTPAQCDDMQAVFDAAIRRLEERLP